MSDVRLADFIQAIKMELAEAQFRESERKASPIGAHAPTFQLHEVIVEVTVEASARENVEGSAGAGKAVEFFVALGAKAQKETANRASHKVTLKLDPGGSVFLGSAESDRVEGGGFDP